MEPSLLLVSVNEAVTRRAKSRLVVDIETDRTLCGVVVGVILAAGEVVTAGVVAAGVVAVGVVTTGDVVAGVVGRVEGMGAMTFVVGSEFCTDVIGASGFVAVELSGVDGTVVSTVT